MALYSLILAGGSGTRLWPLSRRLYPKQFIAFPAFDGRSLFQMSILRALRVSRPEHLIIITNSEYKFHCMTQIEELDVHVDESQILIEPQARNTLGAIMYGIRQLPSDDDVALVLPSDHIIDDDADFVNVVECGTESAADQIVTFGITPTEAHAGYGYIAPAKRGQFITPVEKFHEKPDLVTASEYIENGYLWNAGIFLMSKGIFLAEMRRHMPEYLDIWEHDANIAILDRKLYIDAVFGLLPDISIDKGLLERSDRISVVPIDIYWSDLGNFSALDEYFTRIGVNSHDTIEVGSDTNFIYSENAKKTIALVGIHDCVVIDTPDALLVAKASECQRIRAVVDILRDRHDITADSGKTVYRPWGSYMIIDEGTGFKTKRITVLPSKQLSLQLHHHRSEHWVVVSGTARVHVGDTEKFLAKGESIFIPTGTAHRLENPGKIPLHIIESQIGDYLEEDDIVRFEDRYGRV